MAILRGMDARTAQRLSELTSDFYAQVGESFSATRGSAWPGWDRVLAMVGLDTPAGEGQAGLQPVRVLDLACGNLRFECFLAERLPLRQIEATCVDECDAMASQPDLPNMVLRYVHRDVASALRDGSDLLEPSEVNGFDDGFDLAVCFGFLHHLPLREQRVAALRELVEQVRLGGVVAVSLWQLGHSPVLLTKAQRITEERVPELGLVGLSRGDYLLGWQDRTDVLRYCHDFSEAEVDELAAAVGSRAREVVRFSADGRTGDLNRYLILRREF